MTGREEKACKSYRWFLSSMLVMIVALVATAYAQPPAGTTPKPKSNRTISMDFDQVDIKVFIKFMSELTGKNFVVDDKVRGKVTVLSPTKISVEEAYRVFLSVLEVNGFTTVPSGEVTKVVPSVAARQKSVETRKAPGLVPKPDDRVITQIIPLIYAEAQEIRKLLAPLVSKQGVMIAYDPTDTLIVTDFQSNIQRLLEIIEEVDVESGEATISVLTLEHASAETIAKTITELVESQLKRGAKARRAATEAPLKIVPDGRINVLIVLADRQNTQMVERLIEQLDLPTPKGAGNIRVIFLEHATAEELSKVLSGLPGKGDAKGQAKGAEPLISTDVKIVADNATNALVITAKADEFQVLEPIIKQLDIPRKQVFVEALIMEVTADTSFSIGVNWAVSGTTNLPVTDEQGAFLVSSQQGASVSSILTEAGLNVPGGFVAGVAAFPVTIGGVTFTDLAAVITAAQANNDFTIISTPQLMTLNNEEATVVVADNIPFSTRVDQGTAVTDRAIQSIEYRDVGTTLKITPQISESRSVKLRIFEEVSRVLSATVEGGVLAPTTRKRTAETIVEVKDGQTIVIAGLLGEDLSETSAQVPCLGDIPLVGWLFKSVTELTQKTNLLVFLTPHIVASPEEADDLYQRKSGQIYELEKGAGAGILPRKRMADEPAADIERQE